jgi:hypothetical protein
MTLWDPCKVPFGQPVSSPPLIPPTGPQGAAGRRGRRAAQVGAAAATSTMHERSPCAARTVHRHNLALRMPGCALARPVQAPAQHSQSANEVPSGSRGACIPVAHLRAAVCCPPRACPGAHPAAPSVRPPACRYVTHVNDMLGAVSRLIPAPPPTTRFKKVRGSCAWCVCVYQRVGAL